MKLLNNWRVVILLCLTLGLAPFLPEPHIVGKLRWISGGGEGMSVKDYFDVLFHGFPFILLIRLILINFKKQDSETSR